MATTYRVPGCTSGSGGVHALIRVGILLFAAMAGAARADAMTAYGLTAANQIVTFDTQLPFAAIQTAAITGLQPGEQALAIDLRPATGQIYLLGSSSRAYVVNPSTGVAAAIGGPFAPALTGTAFGFDFDPTVDRITVVSDTGQHLQLDPDTGTATVAAPLTPGSPRVVGSAYINNVAGVPTTGLYAIDSAGDQLLRQSGGQLVPVGPLGVDTTDGVGFDISAKDNEAFAILSVAGVSQFARIDLVTGAAAVSSALPSGPYRGLTVLSRAVPMVALRNNQLVRFLSVAPVPQSTPVAITGLQPGETLVGIDVRPADGQLYGVGSTSRLYLLNPFTGAAIAIGGVFSTPLSGTRFGIDFNPVVDRLRVVSDAEQNLRVNPNDGTVVVDSPLSPAGAVAAAAYGNNVEGAQATVLYDIDAATDELLVQTNPNNGQLTLVGALGVDTSSDIAFDISPFDGTAFAALTVGGVSRLYTINLLTGAATLVGGLGATSIDGLAAMPVTYTFAEGSTGTFFDTDVLLINPSDSPAPVTITYMREDGRVVTTSSTLPSGRRTTVSADANPQLGATAFAATVSSPLGIPLAVERTMRWDATGYGMHTEKASPAFARTWLFAEGSQGFYDTFYLLTNPASVANVATFRFLLENGTQVSRTYNLPPQSRFTLHAGAIPELVNRSFGAEVTFQRAGAAERAMYFGTPVFNAGHESAGVTRAATDWFLAEGATGSFFTTFVLLSNPGTVPADVTLTYLREGGGTVTRQRTLAAGSRATINVALEDATLAATSVATRVTSDVPIVAERAMYWPMTPDAWNEASNAFGVTETARHWGLAEGRVGGPEAFRTYILVANPDVLPANISVTFLRAAAAPIVKTFTVAAGGRLTITTGPGTAVPELADESFGATIASDRPVFVERALYANANGVFWAAGSAASATPLP